MLNYMSHPNYKMFRNGRDINFLVQEKDNTVPDSLDDVFTDNLELDTGLEMELYASENKVFSAKLKDLEFQMNSLAASVKLTYSASMIDRLTDFCLKVRHEIGVSSIKVMNPPIDTRSSLFVAKSESE
ncbi:hypothetical protein TNCV_442801 [Trichonephila clavipes]|nr:hypothetical protein TNCV_442801 [Trichonephila clavipes]